MNSAATNTPTAQIIIQPPHAARETTSTEMINQSKGPTASGKNVLTRNDGQVGALVISLDLELHWGVRDRVPLNSAERTRLLSARLVIPRILDLFEEFSIHATWATVGLLFARSKEQAQAFMPTIRPQYRDARLDAYQEKLGRNEADDPFHFAPELIAEIGRRPRQEIACHSFSHYCSLEPGQNAEEFDADLKSAIAITRNAGYDARSFVFPRNEVNPAYIPLLEQAGMWAYRGCESASTKMPGSFGEQRRAHKRLVRFLDSHMDLCGSESSQWQRQSAIQSMPASRYLRPFTPVLGAFEALRYHRIVNSMEHAARQGEIFHLWWHPEDFAKYPDKNLGFLRSVLKTYDLFRTKYGMVSMSMAEISECCRRSCQPNAKVTQ